MNGLRQAQPERLTEQYCDLTSTYFETDVERPASDLRQYGYSRDKRGDCRQVVP